MTEIFKARQTCYGCPHHDFTAKYAGHSCLYHRRQHMYWTAANNQILRPLSILCTRQDVIDEVDRLRQEADRECYDAAVLLVGSESFTHEVMGDDDRVRLVTPHLFPTGGKHRDR